MNFTSVIDEIDREIGRLRRARAILAATLRDVEEATPSRRVLEKTGRRVLSVEARARIAAAQKHRWAAIKRGK